MPTVQEADAVMVKTVGEGGPATLTGTANGSCKWVNHQLPVSAVAFLEWSFAALAYPSLEWSLGTESGTRVDIEWKAKIQKILWRLISEVIVCDSALSDSLRCVTLQSLGWRLLALMRRFYSEGLNLRMIITRHWQGKECQSVFCSPSWCLKIAANRNC